MTRIARMIAWSYRSSRPEVDNVVTLGLGVVGVALLVWTMVRMSAHQHVILHPSAGAWSVDETR